MSVDAAATLTLAIDTGSARQDLAELKAEYLSLKDALSRGQPTTTGLSGITSTLNQIKASIGVTNASLQDVVDKSRTALSGLSSAYSQGFGGLSSSLKVAAADSKEKIEQIEGQLRKLAVATRELANQQFTWGFKIDRNFAGEVTAEARKAFEASVQYDRAWEEAHAAHRARVLADEIRLGEEILAAYARRNELIQQLDMERYEAAGREAARLKAIQESRDKQSYDESVAAFERQLSMERRYILASEEMRLKAAIDARKLMDAGYKGDISAEFAPQALSAATAATNLAALEKAHSAASEAARGHAKNTDLFSVAAKEAHDGARGLAGALGNLWLTYGSLLPLLTGAAIGSSFVQAAKSGSEFNYQLVLMKGLGSETIETMSRISEVALSMSANSAQSPVEMAKGFRVLTEAGLSAADSIIAMNSVLALSAVGEMTLEQAGKTLIGVMQAFDISISGVSRVGDVFAKAAAESQTSINQMTEAMKTASVVHSQYGASLEETATGLTLLAKVNIVGTAAGTAYRNMLKDLYTPSKKAADVLKDLGIATEDSNGNLREGSEILKDLRLAMEHYDRASQTKITGAIFSERGGKSALQLISQTGEEYDKLKQKITQSQGFMQGINDELLATTSGMFKQAMNTLQVDLVEAFNSTKGPMDDLAVRLKTIFSSQEFKDGVVAAVNLLGKLASAALSALSGLTSLVSYLPKGTDTFISMSAAALAAGLAMSKLAGWVTTAGVSVVSTLAGTGALAGTVTTLGMAVGVAVGVVAALAAGFVYLKSVTEDSRAGLDSLGSAIDSQIEKQRILVRELQSKQGFNWEGEDAKSSTDIFKRQLEDKKALLAEYQSHIAANKARGGSETVGGLLVEKAISDPSRYVELDATIKAYANIDKLKKDIFDITVKSSVAEQTYIMAQQEGSRLRTQEMIKQEELDQKMKSGVDKYTPTDGSLFHAQTTAILKGYKDRVDAENAEFNNYKQILDQRVKYGAISQGVENVLLQQAQVITDAKTNALREEEKQELRYLLASKNATEADKLSMQTRIDEIDSIQRSNEAKRAQIILLDQEKDSLKELAAARKLANDIASFSEKEKISRDRMVAKDYLSRNSSGETAAAVDAYYATIERGQAKLKEYENAIREAEEAQKALSSEISKGSVVNKVQSDSVQKLTSVQGRQVSNYDDLFAQAEKRYNVDAALLKAVAYVESRGNANAVSPQGAQGLMQLMPSTAKSLGVANPFDPAQNINGAAKLLRENLDATKGDVTSALMMYHGGTDRSQWGSKTQAYPDLVSQAKAILDVAKAVDTGRASYDKYKESVENQSKVTEQLTGALQGSEASFKEAGASQEEMRAAIDLSTLSEEKQTEAMAEAAKAVDTAKDAYDKYKASVEAQAQANASLTESLKGPEEGIKRIQAALSASTATMGAMLSANKTSGFYTELEGLRAEGNINKERLSELAELKAAYEAMGNAGAAAAQQIEAQMIELSAHLDPVADKIRHMFEDSFEKFFEDVTNGTKSIKEAFRDLGKSLLKDFSKMIATNASQELMKLLGGGLKPGESQGLFSFLGNIFQGNGPGSVGTDIASKGRSIFDRLKGIGTDKGYESTLQSIPVSDSGSPQISKEMESVKLSLGSLGEAANDSASSISEMFEKSRTFGANLAMLNTGIGTFSETAGLADTGLTTLTAASNLAEVSLGSSAVASDLVDASLMSTAASAEAASAGLTELAVESSGSSTGGIITQLASLFAANGYVFGAGGVKLFGLGGTFANSILTSPTPFGFSSGGAFKMGVAGEAGPEAVMPLTRDSRGRLGVRAANDGPPINITIHVSGNSNAPDVRRAAGQGAREALAALSSTRRFA